MRIRQLESVGKTGDAPVVFWLSENSALVRLVEAIGLRTVNWNLALRPPIFEIVTLVMLCAALRTENVLGAKTLGFSLLLALTVTVPLAPVAGV